MAGYRKGKRNRKSIIVISGRDEIGKKGRGVGLGVQRDWIRPGELQIYTHEENNKKRGENWRH